MGGKTFTAVTETPLDMADALAFVEDGSHGAVDMFIGRVRDHNLGKPVRGVSYDAFVPLAEAVFAELCHEARTRWGESLNIHLVHFKGRLPVGGVSVIVTVSSKHRDEAFRACRYLIEELKHRAPIWKQEHYENGDSEWVKGHALCQHAPAGHHHEHMHHVHVTD